MNRGYAEVIWNARLAKLASILGYGFSLIQRTRRCWCSCTRVVDIGSQSLEDYYSSSSEILFMRFQLNRNCGLIEREKFPSCRCSE